eukprot:m.112923 g.112923  ORF g.112923 m.112923 type:complete len:212 (+) comp28228_c0_seq1:317-952(+)
MFPRSAVSALMQTQRQLRPCLAASIAQSPRESQHVGQTRPLFSGLKKSLKKMVGVELTPQEKQQDAIEQVMAEATKNAPPIIKLVSKLFQPLIKSMAQQVSQMSQEVETIQADVLHSLLADATVTAELGTSIDASSPFQQSSMNINGVTSVSLGFQVIGTKGTGICSVEVKEGQVEELTVTINGGKTIHVKTGHAGRVGNSRVIDVDYKER